jgi:hypothetical protein
MFGPKHLFTILFLCFHSVAAEFGFFHFLRGNNSKVNHSNHFSFNFSSFFPHFFHANHTGHAVTNLTNHRPCANATNHTGHGFVHEIFHYFNHGH